MPKNHSFTECVFYHLSVACVSSYSSREKMQNASIFGPDIHKSDTKRAPSLPLGRIFLHIVIMLDLPFLTILYSVFRRPKQCPFL